MTTCLSYVALLQSQEEEGVEETEVCVAMARRVLRCTAPNLLCLAARMRVAEAEVVEGTDKTGRRWSDRDEVECQQPGKR